jgi:serine/threonine-protein kinase
MLPEDLPQIIAGKYRLRSVLGIGSTGTVYSVEHAVTGEILALKVMKAHLGASPNALARFKREARAAATIRSQHVVRIFDADVAPELGGAPYLVMDLVEGKDLEQVSNNRPVDPEQVIEWFRQVALALDKAHAKGIIHRDLKPENLFLTRLDDGTPLIKILDFGIAKIAAEPPGTTLSGQIFGTPLYMAPEQARGDLTRIGPATDLFALGQIAYRLLTGVAYRAGADLGPMLTAIINESPQAPSERGHALGGDFDQWFVRACDPDPAGRFASAHEQVEALARALGFPADADAAEPPTPVGPIEVERKAADAAAGKTGLPTPRVLEASTELDFSHRRRLSAFLVAATMTATLVGGVLLTIAVARGRSPHGAIAPPPACPVEPAALVAKAPATSDSVRAAASVEAPAAMMMATRAAEELTARPPPVRAIPQRVVLAHRSTADDDPLSDQK